MNDIQRISRTILAERLKLQMGLDPALDIEYSALQAMSRQLQAERLRRLARAEATPLANERAA